MDCTRLAVSVIFTLELFSIGQGVFGIDILCDKSIANIEYINGLSGVGIYHCPDASAVSYGLTAFGNAEISTGEIAHDGINPSVNCKAIVGLGQFRSNMLPLQA